MGNCVFKGFAEVEEMVKVVTSNGGIMELYAPITAECITNEFPGHAIFRSPDQISPPLLHNQELHAGNLYYLLPIPLLHKNGTPIIQENSEGPGSGSSMAAPYRMSVDNQGMLKKLTSEAEVFPRYNSTGVWKVRLVISPDQLSEILAQEARTEALIESVRTVAKCSSTGVSSVANSDQWSWKTATDSA
ncbi:hypothetical protein Adt_44843 [Abeliophyllum distichum]|uniref:Uncharacterized protein n=1 Tax=Abeliophyllum distichum TaxID=126358 RepID=A0ABD1PDD6_9LAMI